MTSLRLLPLLSILAVAAVALVPARASAQALDVTDGGVENRFPDGIEFSVSAESDRPIDSTNTTFQLEESEDWVQFTLDQPMDAEPGTK